MFVKSIMIPKYKCITVQEDESLEIVLLKLEEHGIDAVPVLAEDLYKGIVTRDEVYRRFFVSEMEKDKFLKELTAGDILFNQEKFLEGQEIFESTLLELRNVPLMAVVDDTKRFLGAVTRPDVLEQFESAFGVHRKGVRIAFTSVETEGRIARLSEIAHQFHEHIISLVTFDETDKLVRRIVMKIEDNENIERFISKLEQTGFRVLDMHKD